MKKVVNLLLFIIFLGFAFSNTIKLQLMQSQEDGLVVNIKYGTQECSQNMKVQTFYYCTTSLIKSPERDSCGIQKMDYDENFEGYDYNAQITLDTTKFNMKITIPNYAIGNQQQNILCLAPTLNVRNSSNSVVELYNQQIIPNQQFYFYIKNLTYMNPIDIAGEMHIGQPDMSVVKPGSQIYQLYTVNDNNNFSIQGSKQFRYDGESITNAYSQFKLAQGYYLSYLSDYITVNTLTFDSLIKVFKKKGLKFTQTKQYDIFFQSLEGLGNFEFDLHKEGGKSFTVTFTPQEMTVKQQDGTYYLKMMQDPVVKSVSIGWMIFNKYYIGFNLDGYSQLIAERADYQAQQF
ncbi:hypothetical protein ABPG74_007513 [Tetrahymena malaccensis]